MPSPTYTLIASGSITSGGSSFTFSNIPQTYTDLVVKCSVRDELNPGSTFANLRVQTNISGSVYSYTEVKGDGSSATSARSSSVSEWTIPRVVPGSSVTSNTFGNIEIYIPNYTSTTANKVASAYGVSENNATLSWINSVALLASNTSAITSIFLDSSWGSCAAGSTFWLYGIKNS